MNHNVRVETYKKYQTSKGSEDLFGAHVTADSFEGYEFVSVANMLAKYSMRLDYSTLRLHAALSIERALYAMNEKTGRDGFLLAIDDAWGVVDFIEGTTTGITQWGFDTVTGAYEAATSPVETGKALARAVYEYRKTGALIRQAAFDNFEALKHCGDDLVDCGQIAGKVAGSIVDVFMGIKAIRAIPDLLAMARKVATISLSEMRSVFEMSKMVGFNSIDELAPFLERGFTPDEFLDVLKPTSVVSEDAMKLSEIHGRLLKIIEFRKRILELSFEHAKHTHNLAEGIGGVRYEMATGRRLIRSVDPAFDFIDPSYGPMDLKGPLYDSKTGLPLVIRDKMVEGLAASVIREEIQSSKLIVVDTLGMNAEQIAKLELLLSEGYKYTKPLIILK